MIILQKLKMVGFFYVYIETSSLTFKSVVLLLRYIYVQMTCESHCVGWEHFMWSQVKNFFLSLRTYSATFFICNCTSL